MILAAVVLAAAASFVNTIPPTVPASAASTPSGRTTGTGTANGCLDRVQRGHGWVDACWATVRVTQEADPVKDYYFVKLFASYQGLRWAVFKTDLVGEPGDGGYAMWPYIDLGAECRSMRVDIPPVPETPIETLCGPLAVVRDDVTFTHSVTWTCRSCLLPNSDTNATSLYDAVGVPQGTVPAWDLFVDGGT